MHLTTFIGGGFVLHGVTGAFKGRASAWFSPDGAIQDAEQFTGGLASPRTRPIKRNGPMWRHIARLGKRYAFLSCGFGPATQKI